MESTYGKRRSESRINPVLLFALHQFVGTLGVIIAAPSVAGFALDFLRVFGLSISMRDYHRILTETPYFPVQIVLALVVGWLLGGYFRHRSMFWVWVLPLVILCSVVAAFPAIGQLAIQQYAYLSSPSRLSHFFGWGCQPKNRCLDQLVTTLPFYSATAYSIGALLARKMGRPSSLADLLHSINTKRTILFVGIPCFCLKLAGAWRELAGNEYLRTGSGMLDFLVLAVIQSTIVTFLLVLVTHLIGRQLFPDRSHKDEQGPLVPHS